MAGKDDFLTDRDQCDVTLKSGNPDSGIELICVVTHNGDVVKSDRVAAFDNFDADIAIVV